MDENKDEVILVEVKADPRGEIVDVHPLGKKRIRIVHTLPQSHRGGYIFPNTEKWVGIIDGSVTFYFSDLKKEEKHKFSAGEKIIIPRRNAYREFTEEGVYFVAISYGDDKGDIYKNYREIVIDSLK